MDKWMFQFFQMFNLLFTQKWEENIPTFYFCIRAPTFLTYMPYLFIIKICFIKKVNTICGVGQLLVSGSQGIISRVPGVRIYVPGLQVPSLSIPSPGVPGLESHGLGSEGPGSQVLILDYGVISNFAVFNM